MFLLILLTTLNKIELYLLHISKRECHSFMALNRVSNETAADWLSQTHMENNYYSRDHAVFFSGGNPYKAFQLI